MRIIKASLLLGAAVIVVTFRSFRPVVRRPPIFLESSDPGDESDLYLHAEAR